MSDYFVILGDNRLVYFCGKYILSDYKGVLVTNRLDFLFSFFAN